MREFQKGLGWILSGLLLVLASLGGILHVSGSFRLTPDTLRGPGLLCGAVGMRDLYLQDVSRLMERDGRNGRD